MSVGAEVVDLRSDTLTKPGREMRQAIAEAPVGDEQRDEDPTVTRLLARVCTVLHKEQALFLPGGTMCNTVAIAAHMRPGECLLAHRLSHILRLESAGCVMLAHAQTEAIDGDDGHFTAADVARHSNPGSLYEPRTSLVCVEQTHNLAGGTCWDARQLQQVCDEAHGRGMKVHMDGARLFNAAVAKKMSPDAFTKHVDSVWVCFTKGLGAPIGAVLAGPADFVARARRLKHVAGGGLRQAGIAAAGCLYGLEHNSGATLKKDHDNAVALARGLDGLRQNGLGIELHTPRPETNMVFFSVTHGAWSHPRFLDALDREGVRIGAVGSRLRAVTHLDVPAEGVATALRTIEKVLKSGPSSGQSAPGPVWAVAGD